MTFWSIYPANGYLYAIVIKLGSSGNLIQFNVYVKLQLKSIIYIHV